MQRSKKSNNGAMLGFEETLWQAAETVQLTRKESNG